jgi:hypothetical protein
MLSSRKKGEHASCARLNQREQPLLEPSPRHIIEFAIARVNTCRDEPTRKIRTGAPEVGAVGSGPAARDWAVP